MSPQPHKNVLVLDSFITRVVAFQRPLILRCWLAMYMPATYVGMYCTSP